MSAALPLILEDAVVRRGGRAVFGPVSFTLEGQGITVVLGPNGAGKTSFLRLMYGLDRPDGGRAHDPLPRKLVDGGKAIVFQRPTLLRRSVLANAAYPLDLRGDSRDRADRKARARLDALGLGDKLSQPARTLSAGEAQKLALARALITDPTLLLLDEPTANVDGGATRDIEAVLADLASQGTRIVLATHDLGQARRLADTVAFVCRGNLAEHQPAAHFFETPQSDEARAYLNGEIIS